MTPMPLGLFIKKLQPEVGLAGYDILFDYFVVEEKIKSFILISPIERQLGNIGILVENLFKFSI